MKLPTQHMIERLAYIGLNTPDAAGLCRFYERALGFRLLSAGRRTERDLARMSGPRDDAYRLTLGLGDEVIEFLQFDRPGRPCPGAASACDLSFQHFAIVVADMSPAYQQLCAVDGWSAISIDGPQRLPPSSGGVLAFKFRDPDGHPLELLAFPEHEMPARWKVRSQAGLFLGIDHSAIGVSDSARSIAFYEGFGLRVASRSLNRGSEQARLDGLNDPHVEVTALDPRHTTPHVELLRYRSAPRASTVLRHNDVAATRLVFEAASSPDAAAAREHALIDPDGHHLVIVGSAEDHNASAGSPPASAKPESVK